MGLQVESLKVRLVACSTSSLLLLTHSGETIIMPQRTIIGSAILALLLLLSLPVRSSAEFNAGNKDLQLNVSFFHASDSDSGTLTGDGSVGYFLSDTFEVGFRQAIASTFIEDGSDVWLATTAPFLRYNFNYDRDQQVIPYIGAFLGGVWNDEDITGTLGPEAGLRFFAGENVYFSTQYRYEWFFDDLELDSGTINDDFEIVEENSSDGNHIATVGIGYTW